MLGANVPSAITIGNSARNLENSVIRTRGKAERFDRTLQYPFTVFVEPAEPLHEGGRDPGVGMNARQIREPAALYLPRAVHPFADIGRFLAILRRSGQLVVSDRRDLDMDVDPVEDGAGDTGKIALDRTRSARAPVRGIGERSR